MNRTEVIVGRRSASFDSVEQFQNNVAKRGKICDKDSAKMQTRGETREQATCSDDKDGDTPVAGTSFHPGISNEIKIPLTNGFKPNASKMNGLSRHPELPCNLHRHSKRLTRDSCHDRIHSVDVEPEKKKKKPAAKDQTSTKESENSKKVPGETLGIDQPTVQGNKTSIEEMDHEDPTRINFKRYLQSIRKRAEKQINEFPKIKAAITAAMDKANNLNAYEENVLIEELREELENSEVEDYLNFVASLIGLTEDAVKKIFGVPAVLEGHCTVEMNIQDYFENKYTIIEEKLKTFSDNEIVNAFKKLGFNEDTAQRLSTKRPSHLSLLDIAQIYVEDIFDYDLLLLSGGMRELKTRPNNTVYFEEHKIGDKTKKLKCMNFDNNATAEEMKSKFFESVDNDAAALDPNKGTDELWYHGTTTKHLKRIQDNGIELKYGRPKRDFSHRNGFYIAKEFESAFQHTKRAHKNVPLAFMVFQVPKGFFGCQSCDEGLLLSENMEKWDQVVCFFKSGEDRSVFDGLYTTGTTKEKEKTFMQIKDEMRLTNGSEPITFIRGPFSRGGHKGKQPKKQEPLAGYGDQVCIRTDAKADQLENCWNSILFLGNLGGRF